MISEEEKGEKDGEEEMKVDKKYAGARERFCRFRISSMLRSPED